MAGGDHYCCAECALEHMGKKAYASDHHDTREQYPDEDQASEELLKKFEKWLEDDHGELHPDDDRAQLWELFMRKRHHKTKKEAFVNAGDLLRRYAQGFKHNDPYTGSPGFEHEREDYGQEYGFKGQDEQDRQELLRKEELEHRDYDQGYSAGYDAGYSAGYNDGFNADPYNPEYRGLY